MKLLDGRPFDQWRMKSDSVMLLYGSYGDKSAGVFNVPILSDGHFVRVIASSGGGWDHVSVSLPDRCPNWEEMSIVKRAFFLKDEWAIEYHPPEAKNISVHDYCLHLWRPILDALPIPPPSMVG